MDTQLLTVTVSEAPTEPSRWKQVYSQDFPEARTYRGNCTHEDVAFLVDPISLLTTDWIKWAREQLPKDIIDRYEEQGAKPLRLKIYVGSERILWGLTTYPAIRVESWHHASPDILLIIGAIIILIGVAWAFLEWIFQKSEEIEWLPSVIGLGAGAIFLVALMGLVGAVKPKKES